MTCEVGGNLKIINMNNLFFLGLLAYIVDLSLAQTRAFSCVQQSLCRDSVIDPRVGVADVATNILTPTTCVQPYVQCTNVACGMPSVPAGAQNGFATQNSLPWQAYLRNDNPVLYAGGGVLIDQYHVLTAAHKISNISTSMSVIMGVYNGQNAQETGRQVSKVSRAIIHSGYNQQYLKNDVAILRLATPMNLGGSVMTLCLPAATRNYITNPATRCVVAGWGKSTFTSDDAPTVLRQSYVPIVSGETCIQSYNGIIGAEYTAQYLDTTTEICAGGEAQIDACTQDGGSGLVCSDSATTYSLAGLVLWGKDCGQLNRYGVYLNVPSYVPWIQTTVACLNQNAAACNGGTVKTFT